MTPGLDSPQPVVRALMKRQTDIRMVGLQSVALRILESRVQNIRIMCTLLCVKA